MLAFPIISWRYSFLYNTLPSFRLAVSLPWRRQQHTHQLILTVNWPRTMSQQAKEKGKVKGKGKEKTPAMPRPSSSVILISPTNQVLLLHRVQTSTSFPSAHVFPGGNVSAAHDGLVPAIDHAKRHVDGKAYRMAAVRETFEESGILLAKTSSGKLVEVEESERESARKAIHKGDVTFPSWLSKKGGTPDIDGLIPFTRWITPPQIPKRYTTQMYLYFLPISTLSRESSIGHISTSKEAVIPTPTHDGGVEHTMARFLDPATWLDMARSGEIILYPPQFILLYLVSQFLNSSSASPSVLEQQRQHLRQFVVQGDPPLTEACISPRPFPGSYGSRQALDLSFPGSEVVKRGRRGTKDYVVLLGRVQGNPSNVEVKLRKDLEEEVKRSNL